MRGDTPPGGTDLRTRLTNVGNNGRREHWNVALDTGDREPWRGVGAGTYRLYWERDRPAPPHKVVDAHALSLEVRAELGWIGLVLLVIALLVPLVVAASRLRGPGRHAHGAFLAAAIALLLHAQVDWDWEMPVLFIWFLARPGPSSRHRRRAPPPRLRRIV